MGHCVRSGDIAPTPTDCNDQLDLVMQIFGQTRIGHDTGFAIGNNDEGVGRFDEEKRRFAPGKAHLLGVLFVIAADTIDAVHRKCGGLAMHGKGNNRRGIE